MTVTNEPRTLADRQRLLIPGAVYPIEVHPGLHDGRGERDVRGGRQARRQLQADGRVH
jgi:hypothetical protein